MNRTQEEILNRIKERESDDVFGFELDDYIFHLTFENAKPYLSEDATKEMWDEESTSDPVQSIKDYMPFAWEKANGKRGISAYRSLCHMTAWLWLAGEDEFLEKHDFLDYEYYGKPQLIAICEKYDLDWRQWDDGERVSE